MFALGLQNHIRNPRRSLVSTPVQSWGNFSPLALSPALWLDAADTTTITSSGSPARVSQWNDKSGNGRNVVQATGAAQPTTGANTKSGLNVITFDGNDRLRTAAETTNSVATLFAVANHTSSGLGGRLLSGFSGTNYQNSLYPFPGEEAAQLFAGAGIGSGVGSVAANNYYFATWRLNGSSSQVFVNGKGGSVGNAGANPASLATVGARGDNNFGFIGHIAEIIVVFSVVNENTRTAVENYLRDKWGI